MVDPLMRIAKDMYKGSRAIKKAGFHRPEGAGNFDNMDDHNIVKSVALRQGTIQHEPANQKDIVNKNYVDSVAANPEIDLFFTQDSSDISTYFNLDVDLNVTTETTNTTSVPGGSAGELLFATATKLNEEEIDAIEFLETGIYDAHVHATGAISGRLRIFFEIYQREAGGTENLLATSIPSGLLTTNEEVYNVHASVTTEVIWTAGDRIVIKWYGTNTGGSSRDITLHMEGNTTSRIDLPAFLPLSNIVRSDGMTDNRLLRGDTASHSIQDSGITVDDSDNLSGIGNISLSGTVDGVDIAARDHAESHTIASHSDTTGTGAELDELTDGSETTLHSHAAAGGGETYTHIFKTSDEIVNNSSTLQNDDDITFSVDANSVYVGELMMYIDIKNSSDFKFNFNTPSGTTMWATVLSNNSFIQDLAGAAAVWTGNGFVRFLRYSFVLTTAGTSGTAVLRWAQNTPISENTTMKIGTWLRWTKL